MTEDKLIERLIVGLMDHFRPHFKEIVGAVNTCHSNVVKLDTRIEALENGGVDDSTLAALVNDVQALQAQVRTLQFELARYEYRDKGLSEPIPWDDINTK